MLYSSFRILPDKADRKRHLRQKITCRNCEALFLPSPGYPPLSVREPLQPYPRRNLTAYRSLPYFQFLLCPQEYSNLYAPDFLPQALQKVKSEHIPYRPVHIRESYFCQIHNPWIFLTARFQALQRGNLPPLYHKLLSDNELPTRVLFLSHLYLHFLPVLFQPEDPDLRPQSRFLLSFQADPGINVSEDQRLRIPGHLPSHR